MKATSADPTPPQGHVYDEISRILLILHRCEKYVNLHLKDPTNLGNP